MLKSPYPSKTSYTQCKSMLLMFHASEVHCIILRGWAKAEAVNKTGRSK